MKFGVLCSPVPGHINPMCTIGRELKRQGHEVVFFNIIDQQTKIEKEGLNFVAIGEDHFPVGSWSKYWGPLSKQDGLRAIWGTMKVHVIVAEVMCRDIPPHVEKLGIDCLLIDQVQFQGFAIANKCQIPFISIACALVLNEDPDLVVPPPFVPWGPCHGLAKIKNVIGYFLYRQFSYPVLKVGNKYARSWGQTEAKSLEDSFSPLLQIAPISALVDFHRQKLPFNFHYCGAFVDRDRPVCEFPYELLDDRPIVYASLGTLQNGKEIIYKKIDEAFKKINTHQLIISLGTAENKFDKSQFEHAKIVVDFAPQIDLIEKADIVITHAGMNTCSESLYFGKPMLAIPITNDQPAVAKRIEHHRLGRMLNLKKISAQKIRHELQTLARDPKFKENTQRVQAKIAQEGGVKKAIELILSTISSLK